MSYHVITGVGPNEIKIPALIFSSRDKAEKFLETHKLTDWRDYLQYDPYYTSYYDGCGECWKFEILEAEEGIPFVSWNLD
jgi:hypothetical protein